MDDQILRYVLFGLALIIPVAISVFFACVVMNLAERKGYPDIFGFLLGFYFGPFGILITRRMKPLTHKIGSGLDELLDGVEDSRKNYSWPVSQSVGKGLQLLYLHRRPSTVAVLTLLSVAVFSTGYLRYYRPDVNVIAADVRKVPTKLGDWKCIRDMSSDPDLQTQIQADSIAIVPSA